MKSLSWFLAFSLFVLPPIGAAPKLVMVSRPTVIAFFPFVTQADMSKDPDINDSLGDFQDYAARVRGKLHDVGVDFDEIYASSFLVKSGAKMIAFHPKKTVGYYFVQLGKSPRVEYGVMTDSDILGVATEYFRLATK